MVVYTVQKIIQMLFLNEDICSTACACCSNQLELQRDLNVIQCAQTWQHTNYEIDASIFNINSNISHRQILPRWNHLSIYAIYFYNLGRERIYLHMNDDNTAKHWERIHSILWQDNHNWNAGCMLEYTCQSWSSSDNGCVVDSASFIAGAN